MGFNVKENYIKSKDLVGYVPRDEAAPELYSKLGFKSGLEVHQQLKTDKKLFCNCPVGLFQAPDDYDAELLRHMRPTLSEMGEYDGTALMERKTKKNIFYRIKNVSACTYDIDDTPPFKLNRQALAIAIEIALMERCSMVGETHVTRKQYLDGSIPTGFQRTGIIGIDGEITVDGKKIEIIQLSLEEDSCREISDIGHNRVYSTDRLGTALIETVTGPDMKTPDEVARVAQFIRFLARSSKKVRTGIGAGREDVNVSVTGGTRVEIKGVSRIKLIPELTHNEMFRQVALLKIRGLLKKRTKVSDWSVSSSDLEYSSLKTENSCFKAAFERGERFVVVNLPKFKGVLSFFTQPGKSFANEITERLKVIPCLDLPNMTHSEAFNPILDSKIWTKIRKNCKAKTGDAQILFWAPPEDVDVAIETIEERCLMAFEGIPSETRKSLPDGTTIFERVLPGPDRMYPDTDAIPIAIEEELIENTRKALPLCMEERLKRLDSLGVPSSCQFFLIRHDLDFVLTEICEKYAFSATFAAKILGQQLRNLLRKNPGVVLDNAKILELFAFVNKKALDSEIIKYLLPELGSTSKPDFAAAWRKINGKRKKSIDPISGLAKLRQKFKPRGRRSDEAEKRWLMGCLRPKALGLVSMTELERKLDKELNNG